MLDWAGYHVGKNHRRAKLSLNQTLQTATAVTTTVTGSLTTKSISPAAIIMTNLDVLLLKGPTNGDVEGGLNELRFTILTQGIPANSEGMVSDLF